MAYVIICYTLAFFHLILYFLVLILKPCCIQALLMMLDSRLNKSGGLRAVYVRTEKGVLIEVKPHARLPRTFKRFSGLMCKFSWSHLNLKKHVDIVCVCARVRVFVFGLGAFFAVCLLFVGYLAVQVLQKLSTSAVGKREKLLRVIKNPVSRYLPVNSRKIGEVTFYEFSCAIYSFSENEVNIFFDIRILI